jgi:protein-disulfide isomerase
MHLSPRILNVLAVAMSVVALVVVASRLFGVREQAAPFLIGNESRWRDYASRGEGVGPQDAAVTITIFSDFECPFCKYAADSIRAVMQRYDGDVRMVFRHRPVDVIHPHAGIAARSAFCAGEQGRFVEMHDAIFASQDSLGRIAWDSLAARSGVNDLSAFRICRDSKRATERLAIDSRDAELLEVTGTPLLLVNDVVIRGNPPGMMLDSLVHHALRRVRNSP